MWQQSTWPFVRHIYWMTKIIIRISKPYVSKSYVLLVMLNSKRNKVQSRKLSFAVMENFDTEFIAPLLNEMKAIEDVSLILQDMHPNKSELSITSLELFCAKHGIWKRILRNMLDNLVAEAVEEVRFRSRHNKVY